MNKILLGVAVLAMAGLTFSCNRGPDVEPSFLRAQVGGASFVATVGGWGYDPVSDPQRIIINGSDSVGNQIIIKVNATEPGTYSVELTDGDAEATYVNARGTADTSDDLYYFGETGAIDIQNISDGRILGIFTFRGVDIDTDATVSITAGEFSLGTSE